MVIKPSKSVVEFNEEAHTYHLDGLLLPSVTQILGEFVEVNVGGYRWYVHRATGNVIAAEVMEAAGDFGRAVHKAMELTLDLGPDGFHYPEEIAGCVAQLHKWQDDYKPEIVAVEKRMASNKLLFAGTSDIICYLKFHKSRNLAIVDVKTGPGPLTAAQIAAYDKLFREETGYKKPIDHFKLHLPKDGSDYVFTKLTDRHAWRYFQAKMTTYNFENGGRR